MGAKTHLVWAGVATVVILGAAACSSGSNPAAFSGGSKAGFGSTGGSNDSSGQSSSGQDSPVGNGLLATDRSTYALYVQWTQTGGDYSGTMTVDEVQGSAPDESLATSSQQVEARINGTQADVDLGNFGQVFGTYSDGTLKVNLTERDGTLEALTFMPASSSAFNQAVAGIQAQINSANTSAADAQQLQKEQGAVDKAVSNLEGDLSSLPSARDGIAQALAQLPQVLAQEKEELGTTASDEQKVLAEAHAGSDPQYQVCDDADIVANDMDAVNNDGDAVSNTADAVVNSIGTAKSDISGTQQDLQALQTAQADLPTYQDGAPSPATVNQAVASTSSAIASAVSTTNGIIATANQYQTQAYQYALAAANSDSCGAPGQPSPQPPINANS